ncbi:MAG: FAD-binding oxidoreductase, partial [Deltaproteobacteria bacterium]|nr:FAD-binding oxidoreductase [Deltaproteobacteria bacterium]
MAAAPSPLRGRTLARDLCALLGAGTASSDAAELKAVAGDPWPRLRMSARAGRALPLAEVVAWPRDVTEVSRIVGYAAERQIPIVPVGGRSGQSGACVAERGGIALSLSRLSGMPRVDLPSRVVDVEAGLLGARLADVLDAEGASLGHQPDDLSQATVGGWMATRSASEASSRAGAIEDLVLSLTAVDGTGQILRTIDGPSSGLDLVPLLLGSEGTLCVFTSAHLRIFPAAKARWTRALRFSSMERGLDAMRRLVRAGLRPSLCTLLDPLEALLEQRAARGSERLPMPLRWVVDLGSAEALRLALRAPWLLNSLVEALP